jgi:uncharacterized MAPEG superfamily protein
MMLALATVWLFVLIVAMAFFSLSQRTLPQLAGPRDNLPEPTGMFARAKRNVDNHREGLILFAPFALIVAFGGLSNEMTVLGAQIFFWSRIFHGVLYLAGVPWLRTLAWVIGIIGTAMVAWPIFF